MANKKTNNLSKKPVSKQVKKNNEKSKFIIIIAAVAVIAAFVVVSKFVIDGNSRNTNKPINARSTTATQVAGDKKLSNNTTSNFVSGLEIKKVDIIDRARNYAYDAGVKKMQVIALKAQDGSIKIVLNVSQKCYASGKGHYIQVEDDEGDELICQNCGTRVSPDKLGISKKGCNPIPIPPASISDDGTTIKIDKDFLEANKAYFNN